MRTRSQVRGLLYYRGFARAPRHVAGFGWTWLTERRQDLAQLIAQLRAEGALDLRLLFTAAAPASARVGVSARWFLAISVVAAQTVDHIENCPWCRA
ncbi:hypothetical protein ACWDYH_19615 [Nocardia goodfellowii]